MEESSEPITNRESAAEEKSNDNIHSQESGRLPEEPEPEFDQLRASFSKIIRDNLEAVRASNGENDIGRRPVADIDSAQAVEGSERARLNTRTDEQDRNDFRAFGFGLYDATADHPWRTVRSKVNGATLYIEQNGQWGYPKRKLPNEDFAAMHPDWTMEEVENWEDDPSNPFA